MNQKQITYFLSVYETRSMKKTAEHFFVSPQGISRVIKDMENELGTELFLRSRQQEGLLPTHAAEMLLPHFQNILHEYELIGRQDFLSQPGKYFLEVLVTGGSVRVPRQGFPAVLFTQCTVDPAEFLGDCRYDGGARALAKTH